MAGRQQLVFVTAIFAVAFAVERHTIKVVEEPSSYGLVNNYQPGHQLGSTQNKLKMRVKPTNFSGPALFRRLVGKCFSKTDESYKYEFCPFSNVTQHEQSLRWNPYSGILGVWQEWEIVNNTFVAMVMREGDKCGNHHRTVKVFFKCAKENRLLNVSEPSTCNYHMNFSTPYICHKQAMLVYPTLTTELQTKWNLLEGELARKEITKKISTCNYHMNFSTPYICHKQASMLVYPTLTTELQTGWNLLEGELARKEITKKGYKKYLSRIFVKAGYLLSDETKQSLTETADIAEKKSQEESDGIFDNLYKCTEEYRKLKKEVEELKSLLENQGHHFLDWSKFKDVVEDNFKEWYGPTCNGRWLHDGRLKNRAVTNKRG